MASVDFSKIKRNGKPISAFLKHDDADERLIHDHANPDINKDLTHLNRKWFDLSFKESKERAEQRLKQIDENAKGNKRKDRVEAFALYIPIPSDIQDYEMFFYDVFGIFKDRFKEENIINGYLHCDEVHDYVDHGMVATSLKHIHAVVIPEIDGSLNGKAFSAKENMQNINKAIDELCRTKYNCQFLNGRLPQRKTVEELKADSNKEKELLMSLSDKDPVTPVKKTINTITINKEDFKKLTAKANTYDNFHEQMQIQKQCELQVKKDFNEAKKDKKKAESIIAEVNATKELNSSLTAENIVLKKDNSLLQIENDYLENIIEIGHQEIDRIERYKAENAGINKKIKNMTLEEENKLLRKVISDVATALNELDAFLDEHTNIQYHSKIREMVRAVSSILNKASRKKPETTRDRGLEH